MRKILALPVLAAILSAWTGNAADAAYSGAVSYDNCGCGVVDSCGPQTHTVMKTVRKVVYEQETVNATRMEKQVVYEDQTVTRNRIERETQYRDVSYTVQVPVWETKNWRSYLHSTQASVRNTHQASDIHGSKACV